MFKNACKYASGAIIGSAFVKAINFDEKLENAVSNFVKTIQ